MWAGALIGWRPREARMSSSKQMRESIAISGHQVVWVGGWDPKTPAGLKKDGTGGVGPGSDHREQIQSVTQRYILGEGGVT